MVTYDSLSVRLVVLYGNLWLTVCQTYYYMVIYGYLYVILVFGMRESVNCLSDT